MANTKVVRALIELSDNAEEADRVITDELGYNTFAEKLAFIRGMFEFTIIGGCDGEEDDPIETDYWAALSAIVNRKWRGQ